MLSSGFDLGCNTFSPEGRLYQIEYAEKAVSEGNLSFGLRTTNGIILATQTTVETRLLVPETFPSIYELGESIRLLTAGSVPDGRQVFNYAKREMRSHAQTFTAAMKPAVLVNRLSLNVHMYSLYSSVRPFCVTALIGTMDDGVCRLYSLDPCGNVRQHRLIVVGKNASQTRTQLEELGIVSMDVDAAAKALDVYIAETTERAAAQGKTIRFSVSVLRI